MLGQLNIYGMDKVELAIERLKAYEPDEGYFLAFSGGKDSVVVKALCDMAGVKYEAHYQNTSVDPPELVQFIKTFDDVQMDSPKDKDGNKRNTWNVLASGVEFLEWGEKKEAPAPEAEAARQNINNVLGINATFESIGNDDIPF